MFKLNVAYFVAIFVIAITTLVALAAMRPQYDELHDKRYFAERLGELATPGCMDSTQFIYDTRTYGIRYRRIWGDSLIISESPDTLHTCSPLPLFYTTGGNLWWWTGSRNLEIGGGGSSVQAANGLTLSGDSIILGYDAPLYASVYTSPGVHSYGINADSGGTAQGYGGFFSLFNLAPGHLHADLGWYDPFTSSINDLDIDSVGVNVDLNPADSVTGQFNLQASYPNGDFTQFSYGAGVYSLLMLGSNGSDWQESFNAYDYPFSFQAGYGNGFIIGANAINAVNISGSDGGSIAMFQLNNTSNLYTSIALLDSFGGGLHTNFLNFDGDSIVNISAGMTVVFGMPVTSSTVNGTPGLFTVTFTTGTINPGDTETVGIIQEASNKAATAAFQSTFPTAKNKPAALLLQAGAFYFDNQFGGFNVNLGSGTVGSVFTSNTTYELSFFTAGHTAVNQ